MRIVLMMVISCAWAGEAWAKTIHIPRSAMDPEQLQEELLVRFPQWHGVPKPDGSFTNPRLRVDYTDQEIQLEVPDDADGAAVQAVVRAHVPGARKAKGRPKQSATMTMQERMDRVEQALGLD